MRLAIIGRMNNFYTQVYEVVQRIPKGKVSSYGRISNMLGRPNAARAVGYALGALRKRKGSKYNSSNVPWQRVVNSAGRISIKNRTKSARRQAKLLRQEGVEVNDKLYVNLDKHLWEGLHVMELDDILNGSPEGK